MARFFCYFLALLTALLVAPDTRAAEVTVVSSAFDGDNPFDLKIEIGWAHSSYSTKITRENRQYDGALGTEAVLDVTELRYKRTISTLHPTIRAGLYKDLEFYFTWPYVFRESQSWGPADLPNLPAASTINNVHGICADGSIDDSCREPLFHFTDDSARNNSYRGGMTNGTVGFRWGIMNEERHPWSPSWVVGIGWTFPMVTQRNPTEVSHRAASPRPIADRVNRWTLETALSRQIGLVDPFVRLHYTFPHARRTSFHNCDVEGMLADMDRSTDGVQTTCQGPTRLWTPEGMNYGGLSPAHVGGFEFGAEVLPYVDPEHFIRVAVQLSAGAEFVSEGRDYTILSDALRRLTYHDEYARLFATLGLRAQASRYARFHALFSLGHDTAHLLTREPVGRDLDGSGAIELTYTSADVEKEERNPNYDFRWDQVGRRFSAEETFHFTVLLAGELHF